MVYKDRVERERTIRDPYYRAPTRATPRAMLLPPPNGPPKVESPRGHWDRTQT